MAARVRLCTSVFRRECTNIVSLTDRALSAFLFTVKYVDYAD